MKGERSIASNQLLGALTEADRQRVTPMLGRVRLERGEVLCEPGLPLRHLYLPTTAVISLLAVSGKGAPTEFALTGREGVIGVALYLGAASDACRAVVQVGGDAWRLPAARLGSEMACCASFQHALLRYAQALMTQISQAVVCNRHHSLEQALCRWLLMVSDRAGSDELQVTQQLIADSLGVRREGVTEAAGRLQDAGCIRYMRGRVTLVDRHMLAQRSCECYAIVAAEYAACWSSVTGHAGEAEAATARLRPGLV